MEISSEKNHQIAAAKIAKAYLVQNNAQTYDLRSFEFLRGHNTVLKMFSIVPLVNGCEQEKEILKGITHVEEGISFTGTLMNDKFEDLEKSYLKK